jgi:hypothetical protein
MLKSHVAFSLLRMLTLFGYHLRKQSCTRSRGPSHPTHFLEISQHYFKVCLLICFEPRHTMFYHKFRLIRPTPISSLLSACFPVKEALRKTYLHLFAFLNADTSDVLYIPKTFHI